MDPSYVDNLASAIRQYKNDVSGTSLVQLQRQLDVSIVIFCDYSHGHPQDLAGGGVSKTAITDKNLHFYCEVRPVSAFIMCL